MIVISGDCYGQVQVEMPPEGCEITKYEHKTKRIQPRKIKYSKHYWIYKKSKFVYYCCIPCTVIREEHPQFSKTNTVDPSILHSKPANWKTHCDFKSELLPATTIFNSLCQASISTRPAHFHLPSRRLLQPAHKLKLINFSYLLHQIASPNNTPDPHPSHSNSSLTPPSFLSSHL